MEKTLLEKSGVIYITEFSKADTEKDKYEELWYIANNKPNNKEEFIKISKLAKKKIYTNKLGVEYDNISLLEHKYSGW